MVYDPTPTRNDAVLRASSTDNGTVTFGDNRDWRDELREYNKERAIRSLMMNRTGVCG